MEREMAHKPLHITCIALATASFVVACVFNGFAGSGALGEQSFTKYRVYLKSNCSNGDCRLAVAGQFARFRDPESYAGGVLYPQQVLPRRTGQRVGA